MKNEQKFTPGPWETYHYLGNRLTIRSNNTDDNLCEINYPKNKKEIGEANAALIAAAPELLEACKSIIDLWESWAKESQFIQEPLKRSIEMRIGEANQAIAKAKGGLK